MRWRPRLVLRFGRHGVASPTSAVGHLFAVLVAAVIALGAAVSLLASASTGRLLLAVLAAWLLLLARSIRDAWAWSAATEVERASFRAEVEGLRPWTPPPGYAPVFDANRWGRAAWALAFAALAGGISLARWHEELLVPAMFAAAFVVAGGLDLRRGRALRAESQAA
jgi:amino acid permease